MTVKHGIDVLLSSNCEQLSGLNYGLVTNPTGVNGELLPTWELLRESHKGRLVALFGPEHGWSGSVQDELAIESSIDSSTGLRIYSLYGDGLRKPTKEMLEGLDALVFDIQDVGVRFYTYISTMYHCLTACAEHGLKFIVLDRPNPLGGIVVEGMVLDPKFQSFLGIAPIPIRHGMTVGELALMFNETIGANLEVVAMEGWRRAYWYDQTGLLWVMPSPNIPTLETVALYPGTCLIEGTNLSEGRGTTRPFEIFGAPWLNGRRSAQALNALKLPGVRFRACSFTPTYGKHYNEFCEGVQVHITDRDLLKPVLVGLEVLSHLCHEYPVQFAWRHDSGDGSSENYPFIDWLLGTDQVRYQLEQGVPAQQIIDLELEKLESFDQKRQQNFIYK